MIVAAAPKASNQITLSDGNPENICDKFEPKDSDARTPHTINMIPTINSALDKPTFIKCQPLKRFATIDNAHQNHNDCHNQQNVNKTVDRE